VTVHVDEVVSEVVATPAKPTAREAVPPERPQGDDLRSTLERIRRDEARTKAEGFDD
jgi:hypothetical protein